MHIIRLACVFLLAIGTAGCRLERSEVSYADMSEAVEHGAVESGWIPDWIPSTATRIREIHDLDTNESMMSFDLPVSASWHLPLDCTQVRYEDVGRPRFSRSWWPSVEELKSGYMFYRCSGDDPWTPKLVWVARHRSGGRALHWRAYAR